MDELLLVSSQAGSMVMAIVEEVLKKALPTTEVYSYEYTEIAEYDNPRMAFSLRSRDPRCILFLIEEHGVIEKDFETIERWQLKFPTSPFLVYYRDGEALGEHNAEDHDTLRMILRRNGLLLVDIDEPHIGRNRVGLVERIAHDVNRILTEDERGVRVAIKQEWIKDIELHRLIALKESASADSELMLACDLDLKRRNYPLDESETVRTSSNMNP